MARSSFIFLLMLYFTAEMLMGQQYRFYYEVKFSDKSESPFTVGSPDDFLSERAISRRFNQNIDITRRDLPISPTYEQAVLKLKGVFYVTKSKWFNTLVIGMQDTSVIPKLRTEPFVAQLKLIPGSTNKNKQQQISKWNEDYIETSSSSSYQYGDGFNQIEMLNGISLHKKGYDGKGMTIAVIDAGFIRTNEMRVFDDLRNEGRIKGVYDFVDNDEEPFEKSTHGSYVFSTMGSGLNSELVGTAPMANYLLLRSEDSGAEYIIEEYFWVAAAEYADSAGADIINTSLGYTQFDDSLQDHTYEDMDGNTTFITRGADLAAKTGMLVINSAGNSGNGDWYYISAPADGDSVLAVGAVGADRRYASFSSKGPSADGRTKPNVAAQGFGAIIAGLEGGSFAGSGTSFSSPILSGMAACLWQAHPEATNMEIFDAIERSASQFENPDDSVGFGIPDFAVADLLLSAPDNVLSNEFIAYPNPFSNQISVFIAEPSSGNVEFRLYDYAGRTVYSAERAIVAGQSSYLEIDNLSAFNSGIYTLVAVVDGKRWTTKVVKL